MCDTYNYLTLFLIAPSPVRNVSVVLNAFSAQISWEEPEFPNGILTYALSIQGVSLATGETIGNLTLFLSDTEYLLEGTLPYSRYTVMVVSRTGAGDGAAVTFVFETPQGSTCLFKCLLWLSNFLAVTETTSILIFIFLASFFCIYPNFSCLQCR